MKHEQNLCLICLTGLPKTYYWDYPVNPMEQLFHGRLPVNAACPFLHYQKDTVAQQLIHRFKYEGKPGIGIELGRTFAHILKDKHWFSDVDLIVPVPLHASKEMRRGYNQSSFIAVGVGEVYGVPVRSKALKRITASESQTRMSRYARVENVDSVFKVIRPETLRGKNVLLIDDVVTTGATLEEAGNQLLKAGVNKLYMATLAMA